MGHRAPKSYAMLMVLPDAFRSGWRGATSRVLDVANGLSERGWRVSLLTARKRRPSDHRAQDSAFPGEVIRTPFTGAYPSWVEASERLSRMWRGLWLLRGQEWYHRQFGLGWGLRVGPWAQRNWAGPKPDLVWGIYIHNLSGIVGGQRLAEQFSCPLVIELQDPPGSPGRATLHEALRPHFHECLEKADRVITVTRAYADYLTTEWGLPPAKVEAIYLSFPGEARPLSSRPVGDGFVLLHAGSLRTAPGRNALSLVRALALAFERNPGCRGGVRLRLLGGGVGADHAVALARSLGIPEAVEARPEVPHEQALAEMDRSDVLVVIKHSEPRYDMQIPGKLFEYLGRGKPILGVMRETEAAEILRRSGLGRVVGNDDVEAIARHILEMWEARHDLGALFVPDLAYISGFSVAAMANKADQLAREALAAHAERDRGTIRCNATDRAY